VLAAVDNLGAPIQFLGGAVSVIQLPLAQEIKSNRRVDAAFLKML
jgi:hypothetical protein